MLMKKLFLLLMSAAVVTSVSFGAAQKTTESKKASAKITIDGKLDDAAWATATKYTIDSVMGGESITDSADLYGTFQTLWSDSGIFVAVSVTDDVKGVTRPAETFGKSWNQDLVEVYFDMNSLWLADTGGTGAKAPYPTAGHYQNAPGNPIGTDTIVPVTLGKTGIHYTGTNYVQESFFTWKSLGIVGGSKYIPNNQVPLGFDVCIVDNDKDTLDKAKGFRNRKVWSNNKPATEDYSNMNAAGLLTFPDAPGAAATAVKTTAAVKIDGKLDDADWKTAVKVPIERIMDNASFGGGYNDCSGFFQTLWADSGVFVAVTVTDDIKGVTRPAETFGKSWNQDLVEVYFDMNISNLKDGKGPGTSPPKGHYQNAPGNPIGTDTVVGNTGISYSKGGNYTEEIFFPWKNLTDSNGILFTDNKLPVGFDVCLVDNDKDTVDKAKGYRNRIVWSNILSASENYSNMNDAGRLTFSGAPMSLPPTATAVKTTAAVKIDGVLDDADWATATKVKINKIMSGEAISGGPKDCSAFFQTLWADSGVFVAVTVTDDIKGVNRTAAKPFGESWNQDLVEVYFDMNVGNLKDGKGPGTSPPKGHYQNALNCPFGTDTLASFTAYKYADATKASYIKETYYPWKTLKDSAGNMFTDNKLPVGFDVCIVDNDKDTLDKAKGYRNRMIWSNNKGASEDYSNMNDAGKLLFSGIPVTVESLDGSSSGGTIALYPNPVIDQISLRTNIPGTLPVAIFNMSGQLVLTSTVSDKEVIQVNTLKTGIYFVKIYYGKETFSAKFIKK
jgi:hypothetical protein